MIGPTILMYAPKRLHFEQDLSVGQLIKMGQGAYAVTPTYFVIFFSKTRTCLLNSSTIYLFNV
jgi:hypothetical protein